MYLKSLQSVSSASVPVRYRKVVILSFAHHRAGDSIVRGFLAFQQARPIRILVYIWMSLAPVTDLFIAALLVWFLVSWEFRRFANATHSIRPKRKSRTGFRKTDSVLNRLTICQYRVAHPCSVPSSHKS